MAAHLLNVQDLYAQLHTTDGVVRAVNGVDLAVEAGERVGIVGESGSGKSVMSLAVLGLLPRPPALVRAEAMEFEGKDLLQMGPEELRQIRGNRISMIFQDPMTSLNPYLTIGDQVAEPLVIHRGLRNREALARARELLAQVGIPQPERQIGAYPHQFSGGMRQRAMIAMALACHPALLIADEPTTALDVTIQAQILELLRRLQDASGMAVILISHDLGVVAGFCDRVNVMYAGRIVERAPTEALFSEPTHPYTEALLKVVQQVDAEEGEREGRLFSIPGRPPDLTALPPGCPFAPRCSHVLDRCRSEDPSLEPVMGTPGRERACWAPLDSFLTSLEGQPGIVP